MRARIRGVELYFDIDGMGLVPEADTMVERPVLFLLHGGPGGDHVNLKKQLTALRDVAQLVFVDHRGSGRSGQCDPETQTLEENIHDVDALREHLGVERISVLGTSYGGIVAQGYAIAYPDRVANLILSSTTPSFRFMDAARRIVEERGSEDQKRVCQWLWDGSFESEEQLHEYYRLMGPMYSTAFDLEKFAASWSQSIRNFDQLNRGFGGFLRAFDYIDQLHAIRCPTLVLAGAHDWICPPDQSQLIAEKIPRAHLKIFANSAHAVAADEPDAYLNAVGGFLTYAAV
jgi:proline iminopeptidase